MILAGAALFQKHGSSVICKTHPASSEQLYLANGRLHETGERRENVDGRVDATIVELAVDEDLPLGDVAGQIRDGVRDIWWERSSQSPSRGASVKVSTRRSATYRHWAWSRWESV